MSLSQLVYDGTPFHTLERAGLRVASFIGADQSNIDWETVQSFGEEWQRFDHFSDEDLQRAGAEYFDIVTPEMLGERSRALDVGCGTGRWTQYIRTRAGFVEAIDPSDAALVAAGNLRRFSNVRVTQAAVDAIPFADASFDFVMSLGVLHHLPDTQAAIEKCVAKLRPGGWLMLYLYYNLDNRGPLYKSLFRVSNALRGTISKMPSGNKQAACDFLATTIYWPLSRFARALEALSVPTRLVEKLPLSYYRRKSFKILRNDSLDRFGTPLEKRFSREQIQSMLEKAGLVSPIFSPNAPYWHVVAQKLTAI